MVKVCLWFLRNYIFTGVLAVLKFQTCPEIVLKFYSFWQECLENGFWCAITCCSFLFCWLFLHHAIVITVCVWQLQVITTWILLTLIANSIMTALFNSDVHEWFFVKKSVFTTCMWSINILKFSKTLVLKFYWVLTGPLCLCISFFHPIAVPCKVCGPSATAGALGP